MQINTVQGSNVIGRGNAGPARIAPVPDSAPATSPPPAAPAQLPATSLPSLQVRVLPEVNVVNVDVREFLSMTATLLKRMEQTQLWQEPLPGASSMDLSA